MPRAVSMFAGSFDPGLLREPAGADLPAARWSSGCASWRASRSARAASGAPSSTIRPPAYLTARVTVAICGHAARGARLLGRAAVRGHRRRPARRRPRRLLVPLRLLLQAGAERRGHARARDARAGGRGPRAGARAHARLRLRRGRGRGGHGDQVHGRRDAGRGGRGGPVADGRRARRSPPRSPAWP